mmetsp:Transcript_26763/g.70273  ORF Transcript_26763/g.70273 Transcript_26763/m.70273 type:complete len:192 (-) Transcript_26763:382-957(-)
MILDYCTTIISWRFRSWCSSRHCCSLDLIFVELIMSSIYFAQLEKIFQVGSLLVSDELEGVLRYKLLHDLYFQIFFTVSAAQAFLLNFFIFYCTRVNSPLVTSVAGTVKDLVTNLLGMGLFGDFPFRPLNMVALAISFFGSAWYTRLKYLASVSVSSQVEICRIAQLQENSECDGVEVDSLFSNSIICDLL